METRSKGELDRILQDVLLLARQYCNENVLRTSSSLEDALSSAIHITKCVDPTARLSLNDSYALELLKLIDTILTRAENSPLLRSKLNLLLFNLAFYNLTLRNVIAVDLGMCSSVFACLKLSLRDELGPQNLIDILRLLQVLTYEKKLALGTWTNECITFLLIEICKAEEPEWVPNCCAILCNLVSRSKTVCARIRKSNSFKQFQKRMLELLAHDSRTVVVSALVIIGYLDEKLRDTVFCPTNVPQTFQCLFNVLDQSDGLMTRHIGIDLLKRLVVAENPSGFGGSVLTTTGKDLANLSFFQRSIQKVAALFLHVDARTDESLKTYDLLLAFCSIQVVRTPVCSAILSAPVSAARSATPLWAIAKTAKMTLAEAINPEVPLLACQLLRYLLKEISDSGKKIGEYMQPSVIREIVANSLDVLREIENPLLTERCKLLSEGLRIAEVTVTDDDLRPELLMTVSSGVCSKILNDQIMASPVVHQFGSTNLSDEIPDWSVHGAEVLMELMKMLATIKDFSKLHKDLYWRTLKDERLVPFIAFAITNGNNEMVSNALLLYNHCKQLPEFQSAWLGTLISTSTKQNREAANNHKRLKGSTSSNLNESFGSRGLVTEDINSTPIDDLIAKLKQGTEMKDGRFAQLLTAFERKVSMMENRERELENLLAMRDLQLAQGGTNRYPLDHHSAATAKTENNFDDEKLRSHDLRSKNEELNSQVSFMQTQLQSILRENNVLQREKAELLELLQTQQEENLEERKIHNILREKFDDMTAKFTTTSKTLFEAENQVKKLADQAAQLSELLKSEQERAKVLEQSVSGKEKRISELEECLKMVQKETQELKKQLADEQAKSREIELSLTRKEARIGELEEEIRLVKGEREKLQEEQKKAAALRQQMMEMMKNM